MALGSLGCFNIVTVISVTLIHCDKDWKVTGESATAEDLYSARALMDAPEMGVTSACDPVTGAGALHANMLHQLLKLGPDERGLIMHGHLVYAHCHVFRNGFYAVGGRRRRNCHER